MDPNQQYQHYQQYAQPPDMPAQSAKKHHPWALILSLSLFIFLTIAAISFGAWAYAGRQNYKDNSDKISAKAVEIAIQKEDTKKDNEFLEREKSPLKSYQGPDTYGSVDIKYPKTWSAYIQETSDKASMPINGYFHPDYVPGIGGSTAYAMRVQVSSQSYSEEIKQFEAKVKNGKVNLSAYAPKNVPGVVGSRVDGEINMGQKGSMILLPLRDKTIKISTESQEFLNDFNNTILVNLKFVP